MKPIKLIFSFLLALSIFIVLFYFADLSEVRDALISIPLSTYFFIIFIYSLAWLLRGLRWKMLLKLNNYQINVLEATLFSIFGNFANIIVPARIGDLAWIYGAKKSLKIKTSAGLVTIVFNRFLDFLALVIIMSLTIIPLIKKGFPRWIIDTGIASFVVIILFFFSIFFFKNKKIVNRFFIGFLKKFEKYYETIRKSLLELIVNKRAFVYLILTSVIVWVLESLIVFFLLLNFYININLFAIWLALAIANITKAINITPGGIGTYEAAMATILSSLGNLDYTIALTISILDHLLKKAFVIAFGGFALSRFGLKVFYSNHKQILEND